MRHEIGSLVSPNRSASRAAEREHPATSNNTVPGFTGATQYSTEPLPYPYESQQVS